MRNLFIAGTIMILVVIGAWVSKSGKKNAEIIAENTITNSSTTNATVASGSAGDKTQTSVKSSVKVAEFTNILPHRGNYQCDYEEVSPTSRSSHVVYLSEGKMRGEFRTSTAFGAISNIMVYDGIYLYTWIEGQTVGARSQPKSLSDFPTIIPRDILESKVFGSGLSSVSWNCHAWSKVPALLTKPSYVKFN